MQLGEVGGQGHVVERPPVEPGVEPPERARVGAARVRADGGLDQAARGLSLAADRSLFAICGHRKSGPFVDTANPASSGVPRRELSLLPVPDGAHAVVAGPGQLVRRAGSARSASATSGAFGWVRRKPNCPVYETGRVNPVGAAKPIESLFEEISESLYR